MKKKIIVSIIVIIIFFILAIVLLININENQEPVVNGRELYKALEIKTDY